MVIMRIHYAWKEFFAREQSGDFMWTQRWSRDPKVRSLDAPSGHSINLNDIS